MKCKTIIREITDKTNLHQNKKIYSQFPWNATFPPTPHMNFSLYLIFLYTVHENTNKRE